MRGWLAAQLPRVLADDPFLSRFLAIFEDVADTVDGSISAIPYSLDPDICPPSFLPYLAGWLGRAVDQDWSEDRQRQFVRDIGALTTWRGTRRGVAGVLEAITGESVEIDDPTRVRRPAEVVDPDGAERPVVIRLGGTGGLTAGELAKIVAEELPADVTVEIEAGGRRIGGVRPAPPGEEA